LAAEDCRLLLLFGDICGASNDSPASFIRERSGLKFVYSNGTFPNKCWMEYAKDEDIWLLPSANPLVPPDASIRRVSMSKMMIDGRVVHRDVLEDVYKEINDKFGSNAEVP